ncbi:mitochondrial ATP synthase g subunit domain-containing protein [Phthorimaea operculella]|nr:mitochondrial ATP synthase g subunit domain-containing protein [Phthorimaea operculella]
MRLTLLYDVAEVYKPAINVRKEKLIEVIKEKAEIASKSKVGQKMRILKEYWKVEMAPPTSADEMRKLQMDLVIFKEFMTTGCWKCLTVKQAWLLFLVGLEVGLWFYLGETFGKFHLIGYNV